MNKTVTEQLPHLPGIYLFKKQDGTVLYIGKAKDLKKRVSSYFTKQATDWKIDMLLQEATGIEHILTKTDTEALLLEADLVKRYQPKFNVLLKSGQPFLYLLITNDPLPQLEIVRTKKKKGAYYGPFIHKTQARAVHRYLVETFQLYQCNKKIENGCLDYHLGRCAGTCLKNFNAADYLFRIELMKQALDGKPKKFLEEVQKKIKEYSAQLAFEKAKNLKNYADSIDLIFNTIKLKFSPAKYNKDILVATLPHEIDTLYKNAAQELKTVLQLPSAPRSIDCFDISHFQSQYIVGSCVRFYDGLPEKNAFRRFKIKTLVEQNDYEALREIVSRRYKNPDELPDLVVIDGGKGQRNMVLPLLKNTPCVSLAKKEERLFSDAHPEGYILDIHTPIGKLLISLRDYAHHFAITYHRLLRSKGSDENRQLHHRKPGTDK